MNWPVRPDKYTTRTHDRRFRKDERKFAEAGEGMRRSRERGRWEVIKSCIRSAGQYMYTDKSVKLIVMSSTPASIGLINGSCLFTLIHRYPKLKHEPPEMYGEHR